MTHTEPPLPFDVPKAAKRTHAKCMDCQRVEVNGVIYHTVECPSGGLDPARVTEVEPAP